MGLEIMFADHPLRKQAFLDQKNMDFPKSQYWDFSKGKPMIFFKSCKFPLSLFSRKMNFEIMFDDHPVIKQALLKDKNIEFTE